MCLACTYVCVSYKFYHVENFTAVSENKLKIAGKLLVWYCVVNIILTIVAIEICISCGNITVVASHPLFQGGLCKKCKVCKHVNVCVHVCAMHFVDFRDVGKFYGVCLSI